MRKRHFKYYLLLLMLFCGVGNGAFAQETIALGQVFDSRDKSPLQDVSVFFKNSGIGIATDKDGFFMIRTAGTETTLVFSRVGYKSTEVYVKPGQTAGVKVELQQETKLLDEIFVIPGENPAIPLLNRVRANAAKNNIQRQKGIMLKYTDQNVAYLGNISRKNTAKKLFESLVASDSTGFLPVFLNETTGNLTANQMQVTKKDTYNASDRMVEFVERMFGSIDFRLTFYDNSVNVLGLSFPSPIASGAGLYYNYYLTDSLYQGQNKLYNIRFKSKNQKNQVLNGNMKVDSASAAIVSVVAELPLQSNINFIQQLKLTQQFRYENNYIPDRNEVFIRLNQNVIKDTSVTHPVLLLKKVVHFTVDASAVDAHQNFAETGLTKTEIEQKIGALDNTPMFKTLKQIASILITGYIPAGVLDIGKIQQIARYNDVEGFRMTLPLKTNEKLLKDFSLGGYAGYGFKNRELQYNGSLEYLLPLKGRQLLSVSYTKDYKRIDYNYNNFFVKERPLLSGDEDFGNSILAFHSTAKLNLRKDFEASLNNEWSRGVETFLSFRRNEMLAGAALPMTYNGNAYASVSQNSLQLSARISFEEDVYDRHTQRIYLQTRYPVIYFGITGGKVFTPDNSAYFGKVSFSVRQQYPFTIGSFSYLVNAVWRTGKSPYVYMDYPTGNEGEGYGIYKFSLMNHLEYAADKYVDLHTELITNGLLFNHIPIIKVMNLREILSFKTAYGSLNSAATSSLMDIPAGIHTYNKPYSEVGVGITNILGLLTVQSVWRLTDTNHTGVSPWAIKAMIRVSF